MTPLARQPARRRIAGAILAGGKAARLGGIAKGSIPADGDTSIVERLIRQFARSGIEDVIIVANDPQPYASSAGPVISDLREGIGPLGGIEAALAHFAGRCEAVAFVPCDLPRITWREIRTLKQAFLSGEAQVVFAQTPGSLDQPLCAVVATAAGPRISAAIDRGRRQVSEVWRLVASRAVGFARQEAFVNINTAADLDAWLACRQDNT